MVVRDRTTQTSAEVLTGGRGSAWREEIENWRCSKLSSLKIIGVEKSFLSTTRSRANASDIKMNEKPEKTTLAEKTQPGERLNSCLSLSTGLGTGPSIWSSLAFPLSSSVSFMLDRFAENKLPALEKADTSHEYMEGEQLLAPGWDNLKALTVTLSQQPHTSLGGKNQYIIGQRMMALALLVESVKLIVRHRMVCGQPSQFIKLLPMTECLRVHSAAICIFSGYIFFDFSFADQVQRPLAFPCYKRRPLLEAYTPVLFGNLVARLCLQDDLLCRWIISP
ncbi:hypothetical protein T11_13174 [Trichinella zimbabwensis]|uniref:Uncharacterized protein n=1 Tax=Trichinella zimbabwensis TaxID=268475 RepID=A0A0V1I1G8_9BILA|nr:hypothetical protein T11_13174 [Trichinella zimbabwensis]